MKKNIPWEQLAKYFAGELTREETQKMKSWVKADPEREKQVEKLYEIWNESGSLPYRLDVDEAWKTLSSNIDQFEYDSKGPESIHNKDLGNRPHRIAISTQLDQRSYKKSGGMGRFIFMAAATVLIMVTAGYFAYHYSEQRAQQELTADLGSQELVTRDGERAVYTLNDGSRVILHAGSRLEVPNRFNESERELFLEGEAYFEVVNEPQKPFIVHSAYGYTRVIGTKFLVQVWTGKGVNVEVIVTEGKVAFGGNRQAGTNRKEETIITRNQRGVFSGDEAPVVSDITDLDWYLGWTEGRLVFDDKPLNEIIPMLERWYAVNIQTEDERIGEMTITAEIDYSQPMMEVP
jgi:transmembrane sensor